MSKGGRVAALKGGPVDGSQEGEMTAKGMPKGQESRPGGQAFNKTSQQERQTSDLLCMVAGRAGGNAVCRSAGRTEKLSTSYVEKEYCSVAQTSKPAAKKRRVCGSWLAPHMLHPLQEMMTTTTHRQARFQLHLGRDLVTQT